MEAAKSMAVSYDATPEPTITEREYGAFQHAYDFFNRELFGNSLPHVLVTLQRHARAKGYFAPDRFASRLETITAHDLALNPDVFPGRSNELILSTLVHEMAHVWQQTHGTPPRRSYHDKEWAAKMKEIGLQPSTTGEPGGKETGQSVTHYIIPGGAYAQAFARLAATRFRLNWQSAWLDGEESRKKKEGVPNVVAGWGG
jgi:predicted SprT family Zn-dependent metalloprotease